MVPAAEETDVMSDHVSIQESKSHPSRPQPYRIVYESDTSWALTVSESADDYLHGMFGFMDDTYVDALFWHDGSGGNTANYDSEVMELTGARLGQVNPFLRRMIDEGNDPPKIVVREARKRGIDVFYSFRLNDYHDSIDNGKALPEELATFKVENPEWMIGPGHPYGGLHQLNFALPQVQDLKFAVIEEVFRKYDFDGLAIDFLRSAPYFIPGSEPDNAYMLTDLLRRVRSHLNRRGHERGRAIPLAVRVNETMSACQLDGFDVGTWIDERLIDMIILGSGAIDLEIEAFKQLTEGTGIHVYACVYGWPSGYNPVTPEMVRALATNYWHQGADGIYTFNWNAHTYTQRPDSEQSKFAHLVERLREIHDPQQMRGTDKMFAADRGRPQISYPHNHMHCVLPVTLEAGQSAEVPILVGEDFTQSPVPGQIELTVGVDQLTDDDVVEVAMNQISLLNPVPGDGRIRHAISPTQLVAGRNKVKIAVSNGTTTITSIEILVTY